MLNFENISCAGEAIGNWHLYLTQTEGTSSMIRRLIVAGVAIAAMAIVSQANEAHAQMATGQSASWGMRSSQNLDKFYHYPYVYYPQNYWDNNYYKSANNMYYRYPQEMRIPVYNKHWYNYYPTPRRYHFGHHFITDIF